jgi:uncharacterized protein YbaA (DUF1428 family)
MPYVDGYVLPVPKKNVAVYRRMARKAGKIWREFGALQFRECVADDIAIQGMLPFGTTVNLRPGETVMFSYIVFASRKDRDRINAKVMMDPRLASMMETKNIPFDSKRMAYGGFKILVDL